MARSTSGSGKGGKIVVLHGWGHDTTFWQDFAHRFSDGEVLLIDLPGFGAEPIVSDAWGVPEYAAWAKEKLASLGENNIILLGHSFGGRVAGLIASERPAWLGALILYAAPCLYRPRASSRAKVAVAKVLKRLGAKKIVGDRYVNEDLKWADEAGLGTIFRKIVVFDETEALPKIAVPTLLVWGEKDTYPPLSMAYEMHTLIFSSTLCIMEHEGHNAHLENPILFYGIINQFLQSL
jgi:pimeloyl-ACP methyl ester carboxylesterase